MEPAVSWVRRCLVRAFQPDQQWTRLRQSYPAWEADRISTWSPGSRCRRRVDTFQVNVICLADRQTDYPPFKKWMRRKYKRERRKEKKKRNISMFPAWKFCSRTTRAGAGRVREEGQRGGRGREEGFILEEFQLKKKRQLYWILK